MSPSTRRVWIEISDYFDSKTNKYVTLHTEGVDWNIIHNGGCIDFLNVTLHTEGVDWNPAAAKKTEKIEMSPSTRRVWIEIANDRHSHILRTVTLHTEGVDWNVLRSRTLTASS